MNGLKEGLTLLVLIVFFGVFYTMVSSLFGFEITIFTALGTVMAFQLVAWAEAKQ